MSVSRLQETDAVGEEDGAAVGAGGASPSSGSEGSWDGVLDGAALRRRAQRQPLQPGAGPAPGSGTPTLQRHPHRQRDLEQERDLPDVSSKHVATHHSPLSTRHYTRIEGKFSST